MKIGYLAFCLSTIFLILISACSGNKQDIESSIPTLEEVSGIWVAADTADMEPSIRNFRAQALLNRDMSSISWFVSAPYSGGYHSGVLKINDKTPKADMFRWLPHQAIRKGELDQWKLFSTVKMIPDENAIMWNIDISNNSTESRELDLSLDLIAFISKYGGDWQWWYPYPKLDGTCTVRDEEVENVRRHIGEEKNISSEKTIELIDGKPTQTDKLASWPSDKEILNASQFSAVIKEGILEISDNTTEAKSSFAFVTVPDNLEARNSGGKASWKRNLKPGESMTLSYVMTYGDERQEINDLATTSTRNFTQTFSSVDSIWNARWEQLFIPNNDILSGCVPILETKDKKAEKVYYTGPLTMLYLMNTNLPQHEKVFLTGGPRWGASITFFWDITEWATFWAVSDPVMMKEQLSEWIMIDPSKHYGKDNFGGKGVGNGYSANYWALFQMIRAYVTISRDFDFLEQIVEDKTVLEHLDRYANNWKNLSPFLNDSLKNESYNLADFGDDEWNLLECVPTYKHIVPSFNAGYIWMMRELADFYTLRNNDAKASELNMEADEMIQRLLTLYAGNGVWFSLYPNDKKVEVRHCLDFMFLGRYIPENLPEDIRSEMMDFLYRELMTDNWMRAQSLQDLAAENSDRPDHGPLGAFDGWPAGTMDALSQMGFPEKALDFYHAIEPVTYEGCWAQAHELWGVNKLEKDAKVRIAQRGWHNRESSAGIAMSQVMLKCFFGFYPNVEGNALMKTSPNNFIGTMHHVYYGGDYYTLKAKNGKVKMKKEKFN